MNSLEKYDEFLLLKMLLFYFRKRINFNKDIDVIVLLHIFYYYNCYYLKFRVTRNWFPNLYEIINLSSVTILYIITKYTKSTK